MKKLLLIIVTGISLVSCTKNVAKPSSTGAANQNVFYRDADIVVENMVAVPSTGAVTINFSTAFENNISRIELMSSTSATTFCTTQFVDVTGNSFSKKNYSFSDNNATGSTMYYMLRFKDNNGNWSYSPYLTVKVD
ncbi:MAG: hypothetical protein JO072_16035 [Parafilimonas sp.]|nr:hypothetical protein [Parafilimonas sp.]